MRSLDSLWFIALLIFGVALSTYMAGYVMGYKHALKNIKHLLRDKSENA